MPTLFRVGTYRVHIPTNDHTPEHVHVTGPEGAAKLELGKNPADVTLVFNHGISRKVLTAIVIAIMEKHAECHQSWKDIHGHKSTSR